MFPPVREAPVGLRSKAPAVAVFLALTSVLVSLPVLATTVRRLGMEEIVGAADTIVEGRVESIRSFWQDRLIYTEVIVVVGRALKGPRADRVRFVQLGGRVDGPVPLETTVPGAPIYRVGDEAYFFLQPGRPGDLIVVGLFQGHVPLRRDAQGEYVGAGGARRSPAQFEEEIRRHLAGQRLDPTGGTP